MNLRTLAAFVIGVAAAGAVSAQGVMLRGNIPFSFVVNGTALPAGEYTVLPAKAGAILIKGFDCRAGAVSLVQPTSAPSGRKAAARLVFNRYGDQYFLSQVWTSGNQGSQLPVTRSERKLLAHSHSPSRAVVAALR
jgi:hypothetical protein